MKYEKTLSVLNIISPIILFIVLLFADISENFINIMTLTLVIGWILPFISLLLTGICIINKSHKKLCLTINIINILLILILLFLIISILDKKLIIVLIEYSIILIISTIDSILFIKYFKDNPDPEIVQINKTKKANNGIIK